MSTQQLTGCVKWFDNNLNYGFVTVLSHGVYQNNDIFVHQSNIKTKRDCYRTLYTGECVQFDITKSDNERHPYHAINVSGFNNVPLHCENPNYRVYNNNGNNRRGRGGYVNHGHGNSHGHGHGNSHGNSHSNSHSNSHGNSNNRSYNKSWNRSTSDNVILRNQSQNLQEEHSTTNLEEQNTNTQQTSSNSQVVVNDSTQAQAQAQAQTQPPKNASIEIAATTNTTPQKRGKGRGKAQ